MADASKPSTGVPSGHPVDDRDGSRAYPFHDLEARARRLWSEEGIFELRDPMAAKKPFYCLNMFPYPSGDLHVGHGRNYILGDVVTRLKTMQGYDVLSPMGWDAFGLPAENAAIANRIHPAVWTRKNIARMREQLISWGLGYDWNREIASCEPEYYRWTQWIFLRLYERGLAYRANGTVNWCPSCQTVLANEQVVDGACERCGSAVEARELEQWFFRITAYADALLDDLKLLTHWPEKVRVMQANWIGRSQGASIRFEIPERGESVDVFTTRPDTLYGATFLALAAEHPLIERLRSAGKLSAQAAHFVEVIRRHRMENRFAVETEKEGFPTGLMATHPLTGQAIPIWVANYVLMGYGTGAIMAVPAHDARDFEFATKYGIPIQEVVRPAEGGGFEGSDAYEGEGVLLNSGPHDGLSSEDARREVTRSLAERGAGEATTRYRLRDWLISRQRYWGAPIPMMTCPQHGLQAVPDKDLPVLLPDQVEFKPTGESPLLSNEAFLNATCPKCGGPARRETDTMDTFVDSSWYFMRFLNPTLQSAPIQSDAVNRWLPVNQYIGGVEHAILHLLYSRFIVKVLRDIGLVAFSEPFERLFTQGMICKDGHKMSKSKGNVVAPDALLERYGSDTVRLYTLFIGPPEKDADWNDRGVEGTYRFLTRYWKVIDEFTANQSGSGGRPGAGAAVTPWAPSGPARELRRTIHGIAAHMVEDLNRLHLNTAVSGAMQMVNAIHDFQAAGGSLRAPEAAEAVDMTTRLLAPMAPHTAEGAWARLGHTGTVFRAGLPTVSAEALASDVQRLVVQVNGKVRGQVEVASGASEEAIRAAALADPKVKRAVEGKTVGQVIHVPGRLVSIVAK